MPTWIDATGDVVAGDTIRFTEGVFGGSRWKPQFLGDRMITGRILRESYGSDRWQHTFTIEVLESNGMEAIAAGATIRRKGRNVYRNGIERLLWEDESARDRVAAEKHHRGGAARTARHKRTMGN